jgi:ketosteroid isomerase-like protein
MSQENVELAHEAIAAIKSQDASRLVELTHPDVEWHSLVVVAGSEGYRGHEGIRRYIEDIADALEFIYADVDDAISVGDLVLLVGHFHYRGKASGVETKSPGGFVVRFRDDRVVYMRAFRDPERALAVVGLSE